MSRPLIAFPRRHAAQALSIAVLAAGLVACGGSSSSTSAPSTAPVPPGATKVTVTETEYTLKISDTSLSAGSYAFVVHNAGKVTHALSISQNGSATSTSELEPGATVTLTTTLKAGTYDVFCPIANHKMLGMDATLTVT